MSKPLISVVIPCLDRQDALNKAILSIAAQVGLGDEFQCECIVVDDGSAKPLELPALANDALTLKLKRHPQNLGAAAARNTGVDGASGQFLAFLDSDDTWHDRKLRRQLALLQDCDAADPVVASCGYSYRRMSKADQQSILPASLNTDVEFASGIRTCPGSTSLMSMSTFARVGPYNPAFKRLEDYEWNLRLARSGGRVIVVPSELAEIAASGGGAPAHVFEAVAELHQSEAMHALSSAARRSARSFLHLIEAEAHYREKRLVSAGFQLVRSFFLRPRLTLQLI